MAVRLTLRPPNPGTRRSRGWLRALVPVAAAAVLVAALAATQPRSGPAPAAAATRTDVALLATEPGSLDPAGQGDAGTAAITAQLFESVTAMDPSLDVRPALASDWDVVDDGRRIIFHMREDLEFSDGTPLGADDVVRSWLRLLDPDHPSPLASLTLDIEGAEDRLAGRIGPGEVGLRSNGRDVEVRLVRPSPDFPAIVAGPSFGVIHPKASGAASFTTGSLVSSGAYRLVEQTSRELRLEANDSYWVGTPSIRTVRLVTDLRGRSAVEAFEDGDLDYAGISSFDAGWIAYDPVLGPQLRFVPTLSVEYYGFDTSRPPFDDVRVRQAFGAAVNWRRIVQLATPDDAIPATSIVPDGIPDRSDRDFLPRHDPDTARRLLAEAGYPNGEGFPDIALVTAGSSYDEALLAEVREVLGIELRYERMEFTPYYERLTEDPPAIWSLSWVADYPGQNDFLGVLLSKGQLNNFGRWDSPQFDEAVRAADYEAAQEVVARDVPVVPMAYGRGSALSRTGLLGATQNGLGIVRLAGLAWDQ